MTVEEFLKMFTFAFLVGCVVFLIVFLLGGLFLYLVGGNSDNANDQASHCVTAYYVGEKICIYGEDER